MSVQATGWVLDHSTARLAARLVLLSIANHAKADGTGAWPSYETIATEAGITRRHAIRVVAELAAEGLIAVGRNEGPKGANLYSIVGMGGDILSPDKSVTSARKKPVVTSTTSASDKSSTESVENVTRTIIEPSLEQPSKDISANGAAKEPTARTKLKDALVEASDYTREHMTPGAWKKVEAAAMDAAAGDFDPDDIRLAADLGRDRYPGIPVTPHAIVGWLPLAQQWLENPPRRNRR